MTSKISNYIEAVNAEINNLSSKYPEIVCENDVAIHLQSLFDGMGLRILNSIDKDSLGAFLFFDKRFYLLVDQNDFGHIKPIEENQAIELLQLFYVGRALARLSNVQQKVIIDYNKKLNYKVNLYFEFD